MERRPICFYTVVSVVLLTLEISAVTRTVSLKTLERKKSLDGHTCLTQDLLISTCVWDLSRCAYMCIADDSCQSLFYNHQEGKCSTCSARYTPADLPSPSSGYIHFQKAQSSCDDGWTLFGGSCYALSPHGTFMDGVSYCETNGAHPVYVETSEENEFLKSFLTADTSHVFWYMGMTDDVQADVWRYYGTSETVSFFDFYATEPNDNADNTQQCSMFVSAYGFNYQWADHFCSDTFSTICEKSL